MAENVNHFTRNELLRPRVCPPTVGLSGNEREFGLFEKMAVALDGPYPARPPCIVLSPKPEPRRDADETA